MNKKTVKSNGRGVGTPPKLQSLNKRPQSPSLRGANKKVVPGIKNGKNTPDNSVDPVKQFSQLLQGSHKELPSKTPKEVRLFLSSTFTDMKVERNTFAKKCYPDLKDFCQTKYGIDFSVVDMRWGVTDEASNDHSTEELCLNEIESCKQVGLGPTFVTMVGDRYGYRPIPKYIAESEYDIIIKHVNGKEDKSIIEKWYKKDMNAVPPHFLLQTIKTHIPNYGENSETKTEWNNTLSKLTSALRKAVEIAHTAGDFTAERKHAYNMSVTESEIVAGIKNTKDPADHCLGFIRTFKGLDDDALSAEKSDAARFTDVIYTDGKKILDTEVSCYKATLQDKTMPAIVPKSRLKRYDPLSWYPDGVSVDNHQQYLDLLSTDFTNGIKELVQNDKKNSNQAIIKQKFKSDYDEILHHLHFSYTKCETFVGRDDILEEVKTFLSNDKNIKPLVLYAESGGGKTSVMAKIFDQLPVWFGDNTCRMIRFLGTSPLSSNIHDVLKSVAHQLADITGEILQPSSLKSMEALLGFFPRFHRTLMRNRNGKVVILLDSIDQLSSSNDAHKMKWLNLSLPKNFHIIISTLPDLHGILDNCKKRGLPKSSMIEVKGLEKEAGKLVLNSHLNRLKRCLQADQEKLVLDVFEKVSNVLFLKLALDKAMKWQSHTSLTGLEEVIGSSVKASIKQIFTNLENKFGQILVSRSLGYITAGNGGLTTVEIEDILSIDDDVLISVYQYHPPPVPGVVRIPPLLWVRIQSDIKEYLIEHSTHGKTTLFWYHRQFIETAREMYSTDKAGTLLHKNLVRLYRAEDGIKEDITLARLRKPTTVTDADRQVSKQPLLSSNVRALMCIPYHLQHAGDLQQLKKFSLFKLKFILKKIESLGIDSFLEDIDHSFELLGKDNAPDLDLEVIKSCFLDINNEEKNPKLIVYNIIAFIPVVSWLPFCKDLVTQCFDYLAEFSTGMVTPIHSSLYNKADLVVKTDNIEAITHHYGDHTCVKIVPEYAQYYSKGYDYYLFDTTGPLPKEITHEKGSLLVLKDRNTICCEQNVRVSLNKYKGTSRLVYNFYKWRIDKTNEAVPDINTYPPSSDIETPFIGADESLLSLVVTASVSSSTGMYQTLVLGKVFVFNRCFVEKFGCDKNSQLLLKVLAMDEKKTKELEKNVLEVRSPGANPEVIFACHLESLNKILLIVQSSKGAEFQTSFHLVDTGSEVDQKEKKKVYVISGEVLIKKWMLMKDESHYYIACYKDNALYIVNLDTQEWAQKASMINFKADEKVIDICYCSVGQQRCYALSQKALHCADLESRTEIKTIANDYSNATYLTVQENGEYLYIGSSSSRIDCIKTSDWQYIGFVDLHCGSITQIHLSKSDSKLVVHGTNKQLVTMSQRHFVDQCKSNREVKFKKRDGDLLLDFYSDSKGLILVGKGEEAEMVTFETGQLQKWSLKSLQPKLVSYGDKYKDFDPSKVIYNSAVNKTNCMLTNDKAAVVFNTETDSLSGVGKLEGDTILASTQGTEGFFILTSNEETKLALNVLPYDSLDVSKVINIKEQMKAVNFELKVTASQKYLAIKMECIEEEFDKIAEAFSKAKLTSPHVGGLSKFYALALTGKTAGSLTPCCRQLSKLFLMGDKFAVYKEHTMLLGCFKEIYQWDLSTGKALTVLIKGTKNPMFFTAYKKQEIRNQSQYGSWLSYQKKGVGYNFSSIETNGTDKDCKLVCVGGAVNGFINMYKGGGEVVYNGESKQKPPKEGEFYGTDRKKEPTINHIWISPDANWIASICDTKMLRVWSAKGKSGQIAQMQLDLVVTHAVIDESSSYIVLFGDRNDTGTKVVVFKVSL